MMNEEKSAPRIILASGSPRRSMLLEELGLSFSVEPSNVDEGAIEAAGRREFALRAAFAKAADVAARYGAEADALVIGADTIVCLGEEILGKPAVPDRARDMLRRLRGRSHEVITGVAVLKAGTKTALLDAEETKVFFRDFSDAELEGYVATGHPLDKAGAYGIQGGGGRLVSRIQGDYFNVVGLPLGLLLRTLSGFMDARPYLSRLEDIPRPF